MILCVLFAGVALTTSCRSSQNQESSPKSIAQKTQSVSKDTPAPNMFELIRRQPGIQVRGSAIAPQIQIRGRRSIMSNNEPLFYLNGQNMGHDFSRIAHINPGDVKRVNVVTDPGELVAYGVGASNGVIEIFLK